LVATKDALIVMIIPGDPARGTPENADGGPIRFVQARLARHAKNRRWQVAAGRPYRGAYGIARSYEEAREALVLARRLRLDAGDIQPRDLLVYRVLGRDRAALVDLVALLDPLSRSRGGAEPLLKTLETYFATGGVATETARRLHMSVRTVTYRLAKVKTLTNADASDPEEGLALRLAVLGARLLDWPAHELTPQHSP
jgi:DNA-binding PucR family transcriptional regulator